MIPSGFKFAQANLGGQFQEATRLVTWSLGDLQPGQTKDVTVDLIPIETGEHRLIAHAKSARGLRTEAETRTLVDSLPSLFIEVGHVDDPLEVGSESAYEIRIANAGTKMETNVEVVCTLPPQLEFKGAKCTATLRYRQEGRELIFEPLPRLAPKADVIYRITVKGAAPGDVRLRTRIRADGLKDPVMREESMRIYSDDAPLRSGAVSTPSAPVNPAPANPAPVVPMPSAATPAPLPSPVVPAPATGGSLPAPTLPPVSGPMTTPATGPATIPPPVPMPLSIPMVNP
jgi:hypothetical protein